MNFGHEFRNADSPLGPNFEDTGDLASGCQAVGRRLTDAELFRCPGQVLHVVWKGDGHAVTAESADAGSRPDSIMASITTRSRKIRPPRCTTGMRRSARSRRRNPSGTPYSADADRNSSNREGPSVPSPARGLRCVYGMRIIHVWSSHRGLDGRQPGLVALRCCAPVNRCVLIIPQYAYPSQTASGQPGVSAFPSEAARSRSRCSRTWEYTLNVIEGSEWPSRPPTVTGSNPAAMAWDAEKWRRA